MNPRLQSLLCRKQLDKFRAKFRMNVQKCNQIMRSVALHCWAHYNIVLVYFRLHGTYWDNRDLFPLNFDRFI